MERVNGVPKWLLDFIGRDTFADGELGHFHRALRFSRVLLRCGRELKHAYEIQLLGHYTKKNICIKGF